MKNLQMLEQTSIIEVCMPKFVMTPLAQKQCTICFTCISNLNFSTLKSIYTYFSGLISDYCLKKIRTDIRLTFDINLALLRA